ncbi:MAG: NAD(P)-dependent glycerol-3-phosphate dehydrogenase [Deltaproteobacteria bacterium]|nr:NAD(P)-dependent glycerol-3-phosphate dehydrogenase [Deltaproteobacteria bacterium]
MTKTAATNNRPEGQGPAAVIGGGSWGTALAQVLALAGHQVRLWVREPEVVESINGRRVNEVFLPDIPLDPGITATGEMAAALAGASLVLLVVPSNFMRPVLLEAAPFVEPGAVVLSCSKGIEEGTSFTMPEVVEDVLPKAFARRLACLSGPSFAREVARGMPTAVVVAGRDPQVARDLQPQLATPFFRVYTSPDLVGVELGGAIKNPLAIAAGMVASLELGYNTMAALITRGLAEMTRLAQARGGQMATMAGLSGLGDLVLTCTGALSRNRTVGVRLAQGETIDQITASTRFVAEGVKNTLTVLALAHNSGVEMPIIEAVRTVIYGGVSPKKVLHELMTRELKPEYY